MELPTIELRTMELPTGRFARAFLALATLPPLLLPSLEAQEKKRLPVPGELFALQGRPCFTIEPEASNRRKGPMPWVFYAPTLKPYPGSAERWMTERFLAKGVALAGIDVGESYGSPRGRALYQAFYEHLVQKRGYARKPVLLARSRGGLMLYSWAASHPACVGAVAGIYPVCNLASYPGLKRAAPAYGLTAKQLSAQLAKHNPIDRLGPLAKAKVPILHLHGDRDATVPLDRNSAILKARYEKLGGSAKVIVMKGRGHDMWTGWFQSEELTQFVIEHATAHARKETPPDEKKAEGAKGQSVSIGL